MSKTKIRLSISVRISLLETMKSSIQNIIS